MKKICPKCRREYTGLENYCTKCGLELEKAPNRCSENKTAWKEAVCDLRIL